MSKLIISVSCLLLISCATSPKLDGEGQYYLSESSVQKNSFFLSFAVSRNSDFESNKALYMARVKKHCPSGNYQVGELKKEESTKSYMAMAGSMFVNVPKQHIGFGGSFFCDASYEQINWSQINKANMEAERQRLGVSELTLQQECAFAKSQRKDFFKQMWFDHIEKICGK